MVECKAEGQVYADAKSRPAAGLKRIGLSRVAPEGLSGASFRSTSEGGSACLKLRISAAAIHDHPGSIGSTLLMTFNTSAHLCSVALQE